MVYHLYTLAQADATLTELCRVTKVGGYVVFSMRTSPVDCCGVCGCGEYRRKKGQWNALARSSEIMGTGE